MNTLYSAQELGELGVGVIMLELESGVESQSGGGSGGLSVISLLHSSYPKSSGASREIWRPRRRTVAASSSICHTHPAQDQYILRSGIEWVIS